MVIPSTRLLEALSDKIGYTKAGMTTNGTSSLTIEYLEAFVDLESAEAAFDLLPIFQNKLAMVSAAERLDDAKDRLQAAVGDRLTVAEYIHGIHKLTERILANKISSRSSKEEAGSHQQSKP
jgi:hypothetical protein